MPKDLTENPDFWLLVKNQMFGLSGKFPPTFHPAAGALSTCLSGA